MDNAHTTSTRILMLFAVWTEQQHTSGSRTNFINNITSARPGPGARPKIFAKDKDTNNLFWLVQTFKPFRLSVIVPMILTDLEDLL